MQQSGLVRHLSRAIAIGTLLVAMAVPGLVAMARPAVANRASDGPIPPLTRARLA